MEARDERRRKKKEKLEIKNNQMVPSRVGSGFNGLFETER